MLYCNTHIRKYPPPLAEIFSTVEKKKRVGEVINFPIDYIGSFI